MSRRSLGGTAWSPPLWLMAGALALTGCRAGTPGPPEGESAPAPVSAAAPAAQPGDAGISAPEGALGAATLAEMAVAPTQPTNLAPDSTVPRCVGVTTVLVSETGSFGSRLVRMRLDGSERVLLASQPSRLRLAVGEGQRLAAGEHGFLKTGDTHWTRVPGAGAWVFPEFGPGFLVASVEPPENGPPTLDFVEVGSRRLQSLPGYGATVAPVDGAVLFLREGAAGLDGSPASWEIWRWVGEGGARRIKTLRRPGPEVAFSVTEIVARSGAEYVYRVSDEHEFRYYDQRDEPYFPSATLPVDELSVRREQFDLRFSRDGRYAVLTERPWNSLSHLVIIDVAQRRRTDLPYYGSFPVVQGTQVLFSSDPAFVLDGAGGFRQIEHWTLYALDLQSRRLCVVMSSPDPIAGY